MRDLAPGTVRFSTMGQGRIIGLDYGTKRIGVAVADPLRVFSQPVGAFDPDSALTQLERMFGGEGIDRIVVGWPVRPDNTEGETAEKVRLYLARLEKRFPGTQIILWNEEFTSEIAKELIAAGDRPSLRKSGRGRVDAAAAAILLQEYLDEEKNGN